MRLFNLNEEPDPNQPGNIWGKKFTLISLGVILFIGALVAYRWVQLGKPSLKGIPAMQETITPDTLEQEAQE